MNIKTITLISLSGLLLAACSGGDESVQVEESLAGVSSPDEVEVSENTNHTEELSEEIAWGRINHIQFFESQIEGLTDDKHTDESDNSDEVDAPKSNLDEDGLMDTNETVRQLKEGTYERDEPLIVMNPETGEVIEGSEAGPGSEYEKQSALDMANFRVKAKFAGHEGPEELEKAMLKFDDFTEEAIDYALEHVEAPWNN